MDPTTEFPKLLDLALAEIQAGTRDLVERHGLAGYAVDTSYDFETMIRVTSGA